MEDTEPRVQRLFHGLYPERGAGSQDLAGAGLCVFTNRGKSAEKDMKVELNIRTVAIAGISIIALSLLLSVKLPD